jgi:hypothetical protein
MQCRMSILTKATIPTATTMSVQSVDQSQQQLRYRLLGRSLVHRFEHAPL